MPSALLRDEGSAQSSGTSTPTYKPFKVRTPQEKAHDYLLSKEEQKASNFDSAASIKRYTYLLSLTDLFRHFVELKARDDPKFKKILREVDKASEGKTKKKSKQTRRRKTEREEDAELLNDEEEEPHTTVFTESPQYVNGTLREYQIQGLNWLISLHENSISGILADEMGLGKTLQTIAFLGYLRFIQNIEGPHIVIVPKSTMDNWQREFNRWIPDFNVFVLHGDKDTRSQMIKETLLGCDFDVCISSYEMVIREKAQLKKINWQYIIVDEAHRIKNEESMLSQIIRVFHSKNRLLITGTPLQNNLHELWALLNFLLPDVFSDSQVFDEWFEGQDSDQDAVVQQLHKVLSPFLLRRVKSDVEKSLLPKKETNVYVGQTQMQMTWYRKLLEKDIDAVNGAVGKREGKTRLLNIVMQLRKCCNHPYLFEGAEPGPPFTTDEHLVDNSGKMRVLDQLLKKMKKQGSRVLIFSQMSRMLDILEDYCMFREYEYCRIDGSTNHEDRIFAIDEYNKEDSEKFVFLLTTRAGGLGINLTTADIVVLYDSDWNPQADLQAMDRAHRIGQTKQVHVFRFVTENAIEDKVLERAAQKLRLDQLVIQQGRANQNEKKNANTSKDELLNMIQHGADTVLGNQEGTITTDSLDEILKRGEQKTRELNAKFEELGLDDLQRFSSDVSAYKWDGTDFAKKNKAGVAWIGPSRRERNSGVTSYNPNQYYKDRMKVANMRVPRAPKQLQIQDFQFFDPRLKELQTREMNAHRKNYGLLDEDEEANAEPLTEEEEEEKRQLEESGFVNWGKRELTAFISAAGKHGRENYEAIAEEMGTKDAQEVQAYAKVFWDRWKEIEGGEKYVATIEGAEKKIETLTHQQELLKKKIASYEAPMSEMHITYPVNNAKKIYSEDEDRFLLVSVNEIGLNDPQLGPKLRDRIKRSPLFRFDWFFLSRTAKELSRRCNTLMLAVTREFDGPLAMKRKSGPRPKNKDEVGTPNRESSVVEDDTGVKNSPAVDGTPSAQSPVDVSMDVDDNAEPEQEQELESKPILEADAVAEAKTKEETKEENGEDEDMKEEKDEDSKEEDVQDEEEREPTPQPPPAKRQKKTRASMVKENESPAPRTRRRSSRLSK